MGPLIIGRSGPLVTRRAVARSFSVQAKRSGRRTPSHPRHRARSLGGALSRLRILPVRHSGSVAASQTWRGYVYAAARAYLIPDLVGGRGRTRLQDRGRRYLFAARRIRPRSRRHRGLPGSRTGPPPSAACAVAQGARRVRARTGTATDTCPVERLVALIALESRMSETR